MALPRQAFNRVWRSRFARNVAIVATGTAGAQAITMAFAPLITRIYGPEAFGLLGTFMAIVAVVTPLAAMAYPVAIVLPKEDRHAIGLVKLCILLSFAMAALVAGLLWLSGDWLISTLNAQSVASFLFLIPLAMLFAAWTQAAHYWLIRKKEFEVIARIAVAQSFILNSTKTGIGWINPVGAVLIIISTAGSLLHAMMMLIGAKRRFAGIQTEVGQSTASVSQLAYQHLDCPLYRAPQQLLNTSTRSLPIILLAALSGPAAAGLYTLAKMVLSVPSTLVSQAVGDVFYPRFTEADRADENRFRLLFKATMALCALGVIPFAAIFSFGPTVFSVVFGTDWHTAGIYARWLSILMFFHFINKPSVAALPVLNLQKLLLVYAVASAATMIAGLFIGLYFFESDVLGVALFSIAGATFYVLLIVWVLSVAYRSDKI